MINEENREIAEEKINQADQDQHDKIQRIVNKVKEAHEKLLDEDEFDFFDSP